MTVAAIVLVPDLAGALADADGEPAIRRVAQAAWAGGALPIVVVADDPSGALAGALVDAPVTLTLPAEGPPGIAWFVAGQRAAHAAVSDTTAGLLWPFRYAWVDPETVTSLVEAHGATLEAIARPTYEGRPGFPILVPIALTERLAAKAGSQGAEAVAALIAEGVPECNIELGDPGIVYDVATPRSELPGYQGPPQPAAGQAPAGQAPAGEAPAGEAPAGEAPAGEAPEWNAELAAQAQGSDEATT